MVSEDSRQLVEEHLKTCPACRKMQEEMMRENRLTATAKGNNLTQTNKTEAEPLRKIRRKIRKKRIASVLLAVILVVAAAESDITGTMTKRIIFPGTRQIFP